MQTYFLLKLRDVWIMIYLTSLLQGFVPKKFKKRDKLRDGGIFGPACFAEDE